MQALSFVPPAVAALHGAMSGWSLYVAATLYWAAGLATAPAWSTWVETLVPDRARIRYFARRNRYLYVTQVAGMLAAGWILDAGQHLDARLAAFAVVFVLAAAARAVSSFVIASQSEHEPIPAGMRDVSIREFVARFRHGPDGRLLVYMLSVQLAYQVAQPFFVPYMIDELRFSYPATMTLVGAAVLAKFVFLPAFGRLAEKRGVRALLHAGGLALVLAPTLWLFSTSFTLLFAAQLFAGASFAAYELASFLMYFEAIEPHERTSVLTTFNAANATAICLGSLVGGAILAQRGLDARAFLYVFAASALLRCTTLPLLRRVVRRRE
jgi:MFS family permease